MYHQAPYSYQTLGQCPQDPLGSVYVSEHVCIVYIMTLNVTTPDAAMQ